MDLIEADQVEADQGATPLKRETLMVIAECMARLRHAGASHRTLARMFGWSKSGFYREMAGPLDRVVSQLGQDEAENTRFINEWVSQLGQVQIGPPPKRRPSLPREARLMACLAGLDRDPAEVIAEMPPELREEAVRLAERAANWLGALGIETHEAERVSA